MHLQAWHLTQAPRLEELPPAPLDDSIGDDVGVAVQYDDLTSRILEVAQTKPLELTDSNKRGNGGSKRDRDDFERGEA